MQAPSLAQQVVAEVAPVLATLLGTVITIALTFLVNELKKKISGAAGLDALNKVAHLAEVAVLNLQQTLVEDLKSKTEDGLLSEADAQDVKERALLKVKAALSENGVKQTMAALGYKDREQIDMLIAAQIEAAVARARTYLGKKITATVETTGS